MTTEDVIAILEKEFERLCRNNTYQNAEKIDLENALYMAIATLRRAQQERENPQPLTWEELLARKGEPMTNGDRIRAMSDEELAEFIDDLRVCQICHRRMKNCFQRPVIVWLQEPVEGMQHDKRETITSRPQTAG